MQELSIQPVLQGVSLKSVVQCILNLSHGDRGKKKDVLRGRDDLERREFWEEREIKGRASSHIFSSPGFKRFGREKKSRKKSLKGKKGHEKG